MTSNVDKHKYGAGREILLECIRINNTVRVNAIDVTTGTEVTFQAPAHTSMTMLKKIAGDKMRYVLEKRK